ncbi:L-threonylcarbamoyladenylate synthase [Desulfoscipio geothermicus]|uniref:Threonylcarbamoyl-AMP synthase n=1 Tax=Desulfoscipio geothermicus DSM 3669 TaxID=1121426 RepID=A0A1I6CY95_9FIRM|nr:L-threonylcarbamoyladenylate synthase [Desulfoscipio geothermicus]SFQ98188.1 L-threonylcarbamoyladenylate synthase [Desulfoscipio geothermicus DSM 3669]
MERSECATRCLAVDPGQPETAPVREAGAVLRRGGLVAFPTETVYGLGANALDAQAVANIFRAKGRPADNPLIVHMDSFAALGKYILEMPAVVSALAEKFWPGPLTLVLRGNRSFPPVVTGGLSTVAVRVPAHPVALALLREAGVPVAAPSANASGRPSPTTASHVLEDLAGRIDLVLDGGPAGLGLESTVLDLTGQCPVILRPGGITRPDLEAVLGPVELDPSVNGAPAGDRPRSPGMKYKHYAPRAPLVLFEGDSSGQVAAAIYAEAQRLEAGGKRVGILACSETAPLYRGFDVVVTGRCSDSGSIAASLYDSLRRFDRLDVDIILAEGVAPRGLGLAVMNRLRRAAGDRIVRI